MAFFIKTENDEASFFVLVPDQLPLTMEFVHIASEI